MISLKNFRKKITNITKIDLVAACLAVLILCIQTFFVFSLWNADADLIVLNFFIFVPVYMVAFLFIRKHTICYGIISLIQFFLYYLNLYVYSARGIPIQFCDVYCISDALNVAENYKLVFNFTVLLVLLGVLILNALIWFVFAKTEYKRFKSYKKTGIKSPLLLIAASIPIFAVIITYAESPHFDVAGYTNKKGLPLALVSEFICNRVQPPQGYTKEQAENMLSAYAETSNSTSEPVNIIVIMNESLTDFSMFGKSFSEDPMPYYHSLEENCAKGGLLVPSYGGNTCNTEFEFLTGASLAFLPPSSLPYNQYMNSHIYSICKDEALNDYTKTAIHPFAAKEWRRNVNYPLLGFEDFISGEDFTDNYVKDISDIPAGNFEDDLEFVRIFISDKECYRKILKTQDENNANGKPSFIFAVTVQNHGSYKLDYFEETEYTDDDMFNQYLTLMSLSDSALEYLLTELSKRDEKTIVMMFGDHHPGGELEDLPLAVTSGIDKYITPYLIWANYDVQFNVPELTSANYFSLYLKEYAGLPLTSWDQVRLKATESYSALSSAYAVLADSGDSVYISEAIDTDALKEYRYIQYKMMFDN